MAGVLSGSGCLGQLHHFWTGPWCRTLLVCVNTEVHQQSRGSLGSLYHPTERFDAWKPQLTLSPDRGGCRWVQVREGQGAVGCRVSPAELLLPSPSSACTFSRNGLEQDGVCGDKRSLGTASTGQAGCTPSCVVHAAQPCCCLSSPCSRWLLCCSELYTEFASPGPR